MRRRILVLTLLLLIPVVGMAGMSGGKVNQITTTKLIYLSSSLSDNVSCIKYTDTLVFSIPKDNSFQIIKSDTRTITVKIIKKVVVDTKSIGEIP